MKIRNDTSKVGGDSNSNNNATEINDREMEEEKARSDYVSISFR